MESETALQTYLRTGDLQALRPLADAKIAALVPKLEARLKISHDSATVLAADVWRVCQAMHDRIEDAKATIWRNLNPSPEVEKARAA
jgi:hypothetical protein